MEIPKAPYGLLRMRIKPYKGKPLTLPDGVRIAENDLVGELHCNNQAFLHIVFLHHINPYRACREDLHSLAMWARKDPLGGQVEAIFGRTMLAVGGARLGFSVRDVPKTLWLWLERFFMTGLLLLYTEGGLDRLTRGTTVLSYPKEIWMSRDQLVKQYGHRDGRRLDLHRESKRAAENFARLPSSEFGLDLTEREES
jgi:peptidoglycan-N-acetylglucosamine deacetylase